MAQERLSIAFDLHRNGRLDEAKRIYQDLLKENPDHFDLLHLMGLAAYEGGALAESERYFVRAIRIKSDFWQIYASYGRTLHDLRRLDEALACYEMGIHLNPDDAEARCDHALVLKDLGRSDEALAGFDRSISLQPANALAFNNRGAVLRDLARLEEAVASYDEAIRLDPAFAVARSNRGVALKELGRMDEAIASYEMAIAIAPDYAEAWFNRCNALKEVNRLDDALASIDQALALDPRYALAHGNRGDVLQLLRRFDDAIASYDVAISLDPHHAQAHGNRGEALRELGRLDEAMASYDKAIAITPDDAEPLWNKSLVTLLRGDLAQGWPLHEWRKKTKTPHGDRSYRQPFWNGQESLRGKTILVHWEQGLGDTIQFCRYIAELDKRGARVLFGPQKPLRGLMRSLTGPCELVDVDDPGLPFDFHLPLLSAPYAFRTDFSNMPGQEPYLRAQDSRVDLWRKRIGSHGLKVGICWQGSTGRIDAGRSFPITAFRELHEIPGLRLISLHKGEGESQLRDHAAGMTVESLGTDYDAGAEAFVDAAAAIMCCDLVITSDTAIAHLSGALGARTWVALKHLPDWRWLQAREDSPWYPTMRLFRQPAPGDWGSVFKSIKMALERAE